MNAPMENTPQKKKNWQKVWKVIPLPCKILYLLALVCLLLLISFYISPAFSDAFNRTVSQAFRFVLAKLTGWIPFSVGECILLCIPAVIVISIHISTKYYSDTWEQTLKYTAVLLAVLACLFSLFVLDFAPGYHGTDLSEKLNLSDEPVSAEDLRDTALYLVDKLNEEAKEISFEQESFSVMPYTRDEMVQKLLDAYETFTKTESFMGTFRSRVKYVMLSPLMSYTHITGVYSYFTGESNINIAFPDYTTPYTAAHELAHQRGIAREDEANFIAFLVCIGSDDAYLRYSAYLNVYEYVSNQLYSADREMWNEVASKVNLSTQYEMVAYNQFFTKYQNSVAGSVSNAINDTTLRLNGTEGSRSYGLVVDLTVAYYKSLQE